MPKAGARFLRRSELEALPTFLRGPFEPGTTLPNQKGGEGSQAGCETSPKGQALCSFPGLGTHDLMFQATHDLPLAHRFSSFANLWNGGSL